MLMIDNLKLSMSATLSLKGKAKDTPDPIPHTEDDYEQRIRSTTGRHTEGCPSRHSSLTLVDATLVMMAVHTNF